MNIQLTPAKTVLKGPIITSVISRILLFPMQKIKRNFSRDWRIASVIGGFPLLTGPLKHGLTLYIFGCCINIYLPTLQKHRTTKFICPNKIHLQRTLTAQSQGGLRILWTFSLLGILCGNTMAAFLPNLTPSLLLTKNWYK